MSNQITQEQQAQIYCVKHGHANYVWSFFGYVHCGRCSQQIGDQLGGIFDTTNKISVGHDCKVCRTLKKKLSPLDKIIIKRLENAKDKLYKYDEILQGIDFESLTEVTDGISKENES